MGHTTSKSKNTKTKMFRFKYPVNANERMEALEQDQNNKILFNVGGVIFEVSKNTIEKSLYNSYFKDILKSTDLKYEIFIDRSFQEFEVIIDILRTSSIFKHYKNNDLKNVQKFFNFIKSKIKDVEILRDDLIFYFKNDFEKVVADFNLSQELQMEETNNKIESFELINPNLDKRLDYMFYRAKEIKELNQRYCQKGFFFEIEGALIMKFEAPREIKRIELRPFYKDKDYFDDTQSHCVKIMASHDKLYWRDFGLVRITNKEKDWINSFPLINFCHQYLKITTENLNQNFTLSYIKIY